MTIKEMEPMIDDLNLEKLEVKMKKGRQVHFFVCGDPESYKEGDNRTFGNLIVFDGNGRAYVLQGQTWQKGDTFKVVETKDKNGRDIILIDNCEMERIPSLNLTNGNNNE